MRDLGPYIIGALVVVVAIVAATLLMLTNINKEAALKTECIQHGGVWANGVCAWSLPDTTSK